MEFFPSSDKPVADPDLVRGENRSGPRRGSFQRSPDPLAKFTGNERERREGKRGKAQKAQKVKS